MAQNHVIVVGGGVAGIAAAWELARSGCRTTLVEARPVLGGRARSFRDPIQPGRLFDSCQHVAMGCCTSLLELFRQAGLSRLFTPSPVIHFITPGGGRSRFEAAPLPPPAHLAWAFMGLHHLGWADKAGIAWAMASLALNGTGGAATFGEWLAAKHQTSNAIRYFWDLVIVSALNQPAATACPRLARKVFLDGFLASHDAHELRLPAVPLEDLFHREMGGALRRAGARVLTDAPCREVIVEGGRAAGVACRNGERIPADGVVLAIPWDRLAVVLPGHWRGPEASGLERAGIGAVHFWFDRRVLPTPHAALVGGTAQWLFRHPQAEPEDGYLQAVVSGVDDLRLENASLADAVKADIGRFCPASRRAGLIRIRVVREHFATFRVPAGIDRHRPAPGWIAPGLAVAGDWTGTGWPATMEGACRSGLEAARALMARQGG